MEIVDIIKKPNSIAFQKFQAEIEKIERSDFKEKKIYSEINLDDFLCFTVLLDKDQELVAFSGLQNGGIYQENSARCGSRLWVSEKYKEKSRFDYRGTPTFSPGARYLIPHQVAFAVDLGLEGVFWSMEYLRRRKLFLRIVEQCNRWSGEYRHEPLKGIYNTCRQKINGVEIGINPSASCWQHVAVIRLKESFKLHLPYLNKQDFFDKYGKRIVI